MLRYDKIELDLGDMTNFGFPYNTMENHTPASQAEGTDFESSLETLKFFPTHIHVHFLLATNLEQN